jgi:undecaprenyl-diphosphatase
MIEALVLGAVQGIAEWLPISSEGLLVLAKVQVFGSGSAFEELIRFALFLHLGTFLAALVYFRRDVMALLRTVLSWRRAGEADRALVVFLAVATVATGLVGGAFFFGIGALNTLSPEPGLWITLVVGVLLLLTAALHFASLMHGHKSEQELSVVDALIVGTVQGFAILPGLSRSGVTVATLLLRRYDDTAALRVSFLLSLPAVLAGNIALNTVDFRFSIENLVSLVAAFVLGLATIHLLLRIARAVQFAYFALFFGLVSIAAAFIL